MDLEGEAIFLIENIFMKIIKMIHLRPPLSQQTLLHLVDLLLVRWSTEIKKGGGG